MHNRVQAAGQDQHAGGQQAPPLASPAKSPRTSPRARLGDARQASLPPSKVGKGLHPAHRGLCAL